MSLGWMGLSQKSSVLSVLSDVGGYSSVLPLERNIMLPDGHNEAFVQEKYITASS